MFKLHRHLTASPNTTTILAEGYTDDALNSKYDNHRFSRPTSPQSGTSLGSKIRFSLDSLLSSRPDHSIEYMLGSAAARRYSCAPAAEDARQRERSPPKSWLGKAKFYYDRYNCRYFAPFLLLFIYSLLGAWMFYIVEYENEKEMKMREVKDLERLRHHSFLRFLDLFQNKRRNERPHRSRELLLWYEKELEKVKLPEALEWDMWGALFYVGTIFTTIGYGNIVPRTVTGRALSVVYAIIGIPLVLAILSRFGQFLEHTITRAWLRHRDRFKKAHKSTKKRLSSKTKHGRAISDVEEGKHLPLEPSDAHDDHHMIEDSRTIPIWLALLFCVSWICACAGLFLIWEKRWTFFTSLYFFFISLSTIGLGDVVPDHPHMLILMFWLVIIGLSIVSMLLTVIQIKFEECLYNFMIRMQEEYQRNLANGMPFDHDEILKKAMEDQPLLMKIFGPDLMTGEQKEKIEEAAEQFERIVRETNNKNIQTEMPTFNGAFTQVENEANSMACDPMSLSDEVLKANGETQWSRQRSSAVNGEHLQRAFDDDDRDSMSDATSLPMDSISCSRNRAPLPKKVAFLGVSRSQDSTGSTSGSLEDESIEVEDIEVQTDIAQFQIDEIVLRLAALQASRAHLEDDDADMETPSLLCTGRRGKRRNRQESEKSVCDMTDNQLLNTIMKVMTSSIEADPIPEKSVKNLGVNTHVNSYASCGVSTYPIPLRSQSVETDKQDVVNCAVETDAAMLIDRSMETSRSEAIDAPEKMSWAEKAHRDMMTSPVIRRLLLRTIGTGHSSDDRQADDRSQQTSLSLDHKSTTADRQADDHSQQTSLSIDRKPTTAIDEEMQTSLSIDRARPNIDRALQTTPSIDARPKCDNGSQMSPDVVHRMTAPMSAMSVDCSMQSSSASDAQEKATSRSQQTSVEEININTSNLPELVTTSVGPDEEAEAYHPGTDWNHLGSSSFYDGRMTESMETSTQYSPPMTRSVTTQNSRTLGVTNTRARSSSTSGLGTSIYDDDNRQEVIIQTDDSYLKIARRLDEYRSNRTQFLPVVAAAPLGSRDIEPFKTDRPSERRGFFMDMNGLQRRRSSKVRRQMSHKITNSEAQTGSSMDHDHVEHVPSSAPDGPSRLFGRWKKTLLENHSPREKPLDLAGQSATTS